MSNFKTIRSYLTREADRFVHLQSLSDFDFVKIKSNEDSIIINYFVRDSDLKHNYEFEVFNTLITDASMIQWQTPVLRLLSPKINVNLEVHMLVDGVICYTFPGDIRFNRGLTCSYAVEQSFKWAFGYEYYLKFRKWPFAEMPHGVYPIFWGFSRPGIAA
ncbi:hypothetical protein [Mucilaginibacter kameinonensis]|uniref:hypothetical protein n=1 Tax=Mucilaginibacter kameinonensis TaxID=452286 RepID=UPI000EF781B2|nr:hypothetical protein [Mucilaginibacter kameinonensis]